MGSVRATGAAVHGDGGKMDRMRSTMNVLTDGKNRTGILVVTIKGKVPQA
jgi:hypothetical protein